MTPRSRSRVANTDQNSIANMAWSDRLWPCVPRLYDFRHKVWDLLKFCAPRSNSHKCGNYKGNLK
jgi:hypothetical protein